VAPDTPVGPQTDGHRQRDAGLAALLGQVDGCEQVGVLLRQPGECCGVRGHRPRSLWQLSGDQRVTGGHEPLRDGLRLTVGEQLAVRERPDRFEQPVPASRRVRLHEGAALELRMGPVDHRRGECLVGADGPCQALAPAAGEHGQSLQQPPFVVGEHPEGPGDRTSNAPASIRSVGALRLVELEAGVQDVSSSSICMDTNRDASSSRARGRPSVRRQILATRAGGPSRG
jgi:hypothetical protein